MNSIMNYIIVLLLASVFISLIINFLLVSKLSKLIKDNDKNVTTITKQTYLKPKNKKNRVVVRTEELEAQMFDDIKNKEGWK